MPAFFIVLDALGAEKFNIRGLQRLADSYAAPVLAPAEVFPLALHFGIVGQLGIAFCPFEAQAPVVRYEILEQERVHPLALVFGFYSDKQQVYTVVAALETFEQMVPAEREEASP